MAPPAVGVLGLNGAGKSTQLRIIAGQDNNYTGEVFRSPGYTVGLLEQEPKLDETGTVISVVKEAVRPIVELLRRYDRAGRSSGLWRSSGNCATRWCDRVRR